MKTPSRRERKKQETRQRLLECSWRLFQERGYDDTTVEDITEAADVAKGTFFNYFSTKESILDEIALWRIDLVGRHVLDADDAPGTNNVPSSAVARIKRLVRAMTVEFSPERKLPQHLLIARISAPIRHESAHRLGSIMHDLVQQGQASGEIRADVDAGMIARLLLTSAFHHFIWFHHPKDNHPPDKSQPATHSEDVPSTPRSSTEHATRNSQPETRNSQLSLEAKLIESLDALLDGLGGPSWRNS